MAEHVHISRLPTKNRPVGRLGGGFGDSQPGPASPSSGHGACTLFSRWYPIGFAFREGCSVVPLAIGAIFEFNERTSSSVVSSELTALLNEDSVFKELIDMSKNSTNMFGKPI